MSRVHGGLLGAKVGVQGLHSAIYIVIATRALLKPACDKTNI